MNLKVQISKVDVVLENFDARIGFKHEGNCKCTPCDLTSEDF
jgi:hypothetical protein